MSAVVGRHHGLLALLLALVLPFTLGGAQPTAERAGPGDPLTAELRAWVTQHGPLTFAAPANSAPVVELDANGEVRGGWGVALAELLGLKLGVDVAFVPVATIEEAVEALRSGAVDAVTPLGARPDLLAFAGTTTPWSWTPLVFVTANDDITDVSDLTGRTVTTIPNSPIEGQLAQDFPEATYVKAENLPAAVTATADGEVDLMLGPLAVIGRNLQVLDRTVRVVGDPVRIVEVGAWARQGEPALDVLVAGRSLITDAELAVTHVRWTGFDLTLPAEAPVSPWFLRGLLILLTLTGAATVFVFVLRRRVATATSALRSMTDTLEDRIEEQTQQLATANLHLRASNRGLVTFARSVAHDLRGPIAAIGGLAQLLRSGAAPEDRREEILDRIVNSAGRQDETILRMLAEAELADAAKTPQVTGEDLQSWVVEILGPELATGGASVDADFPRDLLDVDTDVLARTLLNLAGNAVKHGGEGVHVDLALRPTESTWLLEVADDGPGVPSERRSEIFVDGVRLDRATAGTGFGLAGVREAVARAGGTIEIEASPSGGALFRVTLPRIEPAVPSGA